MRCPPRLGARGIGHVVGSCIMAAPAYASDTSGRDFQQFVDDVGRNRDFFISVASAAFAFGQLVAAFKASPEGKIQEALAKTMELFEPSRPQDEVIQRPVMETLRQRIASWQQHATIIGGRYQSGKSVATEEALRGVRGVVRFTIRSADWADRMCKQLGVDDEGLFKEVMRRVPEKLKDFPNNLTKFPILLLEVPRTTTEGLAGQNMFFQFSSDAVTHFALVCLFPFRSPRHQLNLFYCEGCGDGQNRKCHSCPPASMLNSKASNKTMLSECSSVQLSFVQGDCISLLGSSGAGFRCWWN